jgi:hypothetical protein
MAASFASTDASASVVEDQLDRAVAEHLIRQAEIAALGV